MALFLCCCHGKFWHLTLCQTSTGFYMSSVQVFWKHWEKEKLLVTSNFSFSDSVFYLFGELSAFFIKFEIVSFSLEESKICHLGKGWLCISFIAEDMQFKLVCAKPHSSFGNIQDLRTGSGWFNPWLGQYSFRGLMIVIVTGFRYCAECWFKEFQECMDSCTGCRNITEIMLKTPFKKPQ